MHRSTTIFIVAATVLVAAVLFGGGAQRGLPSDALPELVSLPLIFLCAISGWRQLRQRALLAVFLAAALIVPIAQLVPLPPAIWQTLPGRDAIASVLNAAGVTPSWLAISLRPSETWRSLLSLLPAVALCLAVASLDLKRRVWLVTLLIGLVLLSVVVSFLQILGGPASALYFYKFTNPGRAVGFFANANHYTALLYASLPLAVALLAERITVNSTAHVAALAVAAFGYLVGLAISGSRTALALGGVSLLASAIFVARETLALYLSRARLAAAAAVAAFAVTPVLLGVGLLTILRRIEEQDLLEDTRWKILPATLEVLKKYAPFGSGLGTFERAYQVNEAPSDLIINTVNHAHNDWVELVLESGAPAGILLAMWILALIFWSVRSFKSGFSLERRLEKAAVIALWLVTLHSLWDYPLRTIAISSIFGLCTGLMTAPTAANATDLHSVFPGLFGQGASRRRRKRRHESHEQVG